MAIKDLYLCDIDYNFFIDRFNYQGFEEISTIGYSDQKIFYSIIILGKNSKEKWIFSRISNILGILHSRYLLTISGAKKIFEKIKNNTYGVCSNLVCLNTPVLPVGISKDLNKSKFLTFCPNCQGFMTPIIGETVDGAFFGSDYIFYLYSVYPELIKIDTKLYFPNNLFGFRTSFCNSSEKRKTIDLIDIKRNFLVQKNHKLLSNKIYWAKKA
mmetsp:Transcript_9196/g.14534  ORF Transcript_9196/g.14534 Transcript_9196/m.14534 type:complete len:213 (+) Transcript_9196:168-806(+)